MINKIRNKKQYHQVMAMVEGYLQKATDGGGFHALSEQEAAELEKLSLLAERYEDENMKLMPMPITLSAVVEAKKEDLGVTQKGLACIGAPKLSQILNGKRDPDVGFLKSLHQKLGIDGNFILEKV
jgi:HTH-type transcriptional regulator/antitoxin HigA